MVALKATTTKGMRVILSKPTMRNTKQEIQDYLTAQGIEYDASATKEQLLELIK